MQNLRHVLTASLCILLVVGTSLYLYDNWPWLWRVALRSATGGSPASGWYVFELENATGKDLIVEIKNLNDKNWEVRSARKKRIQERLGRTDTLELRLSSEAGQLIILPSFKNRNMGLVGIFARSNWRNVDERIGYPQEVALLVIPAHMTSGVHPNYAPTDTEYPVVTIELRHLQPISPEVLRNFRSINIELRNGEHP